MTIHLGVLHDFEDISDGSCAADHEQAPRRRHALLQIDLSFSCLKCGKVLYDMPETLV